MHLMTLLAYLSPQARWEAEQRELQLRQCQRRDAFELVVSLVHLETSHEEGRRQLTSLGLHGLKDEL